MTVFKPVTLPAMVLAPSLAYSTPEFVRPVICKAPCSPAIEAAVAFSNDDTGSVFRAAGKVAAYAFIPGLGARDPGIGTEQEVLGRGIAAAAFSCDRNRDVSIFEFGRFIGRQ